MEIEKIEGYVRCLLESWALHEDGEERVVWETLHDLLMAVSRYELMSAAEKDMTTKLCKKLQYHFETKFSLKERKRKAKKENFPPNPLLKEKQTKEIEENTYIYVCDPNDAKEAFRMECLKYVRQYDTQLVTNFYNWYSTESPTTGRMRFQDEPYWDTKKRLEVWVNNPISTNSVAASERLKKARGKRQKEGNEEQKSKELAAQREEANARLEEQIEQSKAGAVTREEWLAMKAERERNNEGNDADKAG